jgi:DNA-directed RNA polymerase specialized sigma24 family protein
MPGAAQSDPNTLRFRIFRELAGTLLEKDSLDEARFSEYQAVLQYHARGYLKQAFPDRSPKERGNDARDAVSKFWLETFRKLSRIRETESPAGFLCGIYDNILKQAVDKLVRQARIKERLQTSPESAMSYPLMPFEEVLDREMLREQLFKVCTESEKELYQLLAQGFSYHEMADRLQLNPGVVRTRVYRLKQKLGREFRDYR